MEDVKFIKKEVVKENSIIPPEYVEVKLSSIGKLNLPATIHVRNYSGQDTLDLALASEKNMMTTVLYVLKKCIWEDIEDITLLHYDEVEEIMMNIFAIFWASTKDSQLTKIRYPFTEEELQEAVDLGLVPEKDVEVIRSGKKPITVNVPFSKIKTIPLVDTFKEPFHLKIGNQDVGMRLPRIKDIIEASNYAEEKYAFEIQKYYEIAQLVDAGRTYEAVKLEGYTDYIKYIEHYNGEYGKVKQSSLLLSYNGKPLETIEDKIKAYDEIDLRIWSAYSSQVLNKCKFGVDDNVKIKSPLTQKSVERRLPFRLTDYFPDIESAGDAGVSIQFGD